MKRKNTAARQQLYDESRYKKLKEEVFWAAFGAAKEAASCGDWPGPVWLTLVRIIEYSGFAEEYAEYMRKLRDENGEAWITPKWCYAP